MTIRFHSVFVIEQLQSHAAKTKMDSKNGLAALRQRLFLVVKPRSNRNALIGTLNLFPQKLMLNLFSERDHRNGGRGYKR